MPPRTGEKAVVVEALRREIQDRLSKQKKPETFPRESPIDQAMLAAWRTANQSTQHLKHALHHEAFREAGQAIVILNEYQRIIDANFAAFTWTGLDESQLIGLSWENLWANPVPGADAIADSGGAAFNLQIKRDEAEDPLDVDVSINRFSHNKSIRYVVIFHDVTKHNRVQTALRLVAAGTAASTGKKFFRKCVQYLAQAAGVKWAMATEFLNEERTEAHTFAVWEGDHFAEDFSYAIADTPCELVLDGHVCHFENYMKDLFPREKELVTYDINSYRGTPLFNSKGEVMGHLAIYDHAPLKETAEIAMLMQIFTARASAELERMQADRQLESHKELLEEEVRLRTEEIRNALAEVESLKDKLAAENLYLKEEIQTRHGFVDIVGNSPKLVTVLNALAKVAPTEATVLITGESGTGKELIARAIHQRSNRSSQPLIQVNCGAISATLVESELFGHVKGAFTGASRDRPGRFELAHNGTLFLDEVGELPLDIQVKLLRVLQEGKFERLGGTNSIEVNVRIVAATNRDLNREVAEGRFREDLYYRLNTFPLELPPLRERTADIPALAHHFLEQQKNTLNRSLTGFSDQAIKRLRAYAWPGNIRELKNVVERCVYRHDSTAEVETIVFDPFDSPFRPQNRS
ncbi:MAG: sigma 54-interacting transcriptional regulator, partial [Verrucomicrobiae bacterium]|nr:sigma 54-interacting transcriptional regulator [Verrucomicrobiae bacterium]